MTLLLQTISCLLIYPNPDSALNASAGALMQENYATFAHQAKLMTSIHAPIPLDLKSAVTEAKLRGEEAGTVLDEQSDNTSIQRPQKHKRTRPAVKKPTRKTPSEIPSQSSSRPFAQPTPPMSDDMMSEDEIDPASASKENNPSLSPSPVTLAPPSPRKTALGKRPLSVLSIPYPEEEADMMLIDESDTDTPMTSNEQNISANTRSRTSSPLRKTPKLSLLCGGVNASGRFRDEMPIFEDVPQLPIADPLRHLSGDGKENHVSATARKEKRSLSPSKTLGTTPHSPAHTNPPTPSLSSFSDVPSRVTKKKSTGVHKRPAFKAKPRIGIRRL
jgi:ubiquitin-conjugating enzyme E2 S